MSDLLKKWLRDDIGLPWLVGSFEQDFASGYAFGDILHRCNLQPDFDDFINKNSPDAMINNYTRLRPTMTKLGVKMDSRVASALMGEEKGVAQKVVYELKMALDALNKELLETRPTMPLVSVRAGKTQREGFDSVMHGGFDKSVRTMVNNPTKILESLHLSKFDAAGMQHANTVREYQEQTKQAEAMERSDRYNKMVDTMRTNRADKSQRLASDMEKHGQNMSIRRGTVKAEVRVELSLAEKSTQRRYLSSLKADREANEGIEGFERTLRGLGVGGLDEPSVDAPNDDIIPLSETTASAAAHLQKIKKQMPEPQLLAQESEAYLDRIKAKKAEETAARRERERRRRKVLLEQQRTAEASEEARGSEQLAELLTRASAEEARVAERLWQLRQEKEVVRENRALRDQQYEDQRARDWEYAIAYSAQVSALRRDEYQAAATRESERWKEEEGERKRQKKKQRAAMCRELVHELMGLAEMCGNYRSCSDTKVPRTEWREWVAMFVAGVPLYEPTPVVTEPPKETGASIIDQETVTAYLTSRGEWESEEPIGFNPRLSEVVEELSGKTYCPIPQKDLPDTRRVPLKVAIVGAPFSGKTTVASTLAEKLTCALLEPKALLAAAIKAAQDKETVTVPVAEGSGEGGAERGTQEVPSERAALGQQALEVLAMGQQVPDQLVVQLIVAAIRTLKIQEGEGAFEVQDVLDQLAAEQAAAAAAAASGKGGKGKPAAKPAAKPAPKKDAGKGAKGKKGAVTEAVEEGAVRGFILDGFPLTYEQAVLLERSLTGLDLEMEAERKRNASQLAPPKGLSADEEPAPVAGLDLVVELKVDNSEEVLLKRALGRRVDPLTGRVYHLEFDPPPTDDPGLADRLKDLAEEDAAHVLQRLAADSQEAGPLLSWFKRFGIDRTLDASRLPVSDASTNAVHMLAVVLGAKKAARQASLALQAASKAAALAGDAAAAADAARVAVEAAAAQLLAGKAVEMEAMAAITAGGGATKKPAKGAAAGTLDPAVEAAQEVLKAKAGEAAAEQLRIAKAAHAEALVAAQSAAASAEAAAKAAEAASAATAGADAAAEAKLVAETAAAEAAKACVTAKAAAHKAAEAEAVAKKALENAEAAKEGTLVPERPLSPPTDKKKGGAAAAPEKQAPADKAADKKAPPGKKGAKGQPEPEEPELPTVPAVKGDMDKAFAAILFKQWRALEDSFLKGGLRHIFQCLREERALALDYFRQVKLQYLEFLKRADEKQAIVTKFQLEFNAVDLDLRMEDETKAELLLRTDELRDALWDICDRRLEECMEELKSIKTDSWIKDHAAILASHFAALVQLEVDRHQSTHLLLKDYFHAIYDVLHPAGSAGAAAISATDVVTPNPAVLQEMTKPGVELPEWLKSVMAKAPPLAQALWKAMSLVGQPIPYEPPPADDPHLRTPQSRANLLASAADLKAVMMREDDVLLARLRRIAEKALSFIGELEGDGERTFELMRSWMSERYKVGTYY
eukprot:jgi/Mesvir1/14882/Mv25026-RA.1